MFRFLLLFFVDKFIKTKITQRIQHSLFTANNNEQHFQMFRERISTVIQVLDHMDKNFKKFSQMIEKPHL